MTKIDFELVETQGERFPWGGYDRSKKTMAVIACSDDGRAVSVLWTVGGAIAMELEEGGLGHNDLGLDTEPGIWVWEGVAVWIPGGYYTPDDGEMELQGSFRKPTDEEWTAIRDGRCPWDWSLWMVPGYAEAMAEEEPEEAVSARNNR